MDRHSWLTLTLNDPRPLYAQVIEQIQRRVAVGDLPPGAELPSIRELAADLKVSVITIKRAYLELERAGTIVTRQGKGSMVSEAPGLSAALQVRELEQHLEEAAALGELLGISKTDLQRRLGAACDRRQAGRKPTKDNP